MRTEALILGKERGRAIPFASINTFFYRSAVLSFKDLGKDM